MTAAILVPSKSEQSRFNTHDSSTFDCTFTEFRRDFSDGTGIYRGDIKESPKAPSINIQETKRAGNTSRPRRYRLLPD